MKKPETTQEAMDNVVAAFKELGAEFDKHFKVTVLIKKLNKALVTLGDKMKKYQIKDGKLHRFDDFVGRYGIVIVLVMAVVVALLAAMK